MEDVASHAAGDGEAPQAVQQTDGDTAALAVGVAETPRDTVLNGTGMGVAQVPGYGSLALNAAHDLLAQRLPTRTRQQMSMSTIRNHNSIQLSLSRLCCPSPKWREDLYYYAESIRKRIGAENEYKQQVG